MSVSGSSIRQVAPLIPHHLSSQGAESVVGFVRVLKHRSVVREPHHEQRPLALRLPLEVELGRLPFFEAHGELGAGGDAAGVRFQHRPIFWARDDGGAQPPGERLDVDEHLALHAKGQRRGGREQPALTVPEGELETLAGHVGAYPDSVDVGEAVLRAYDGGQLLVANACEGHAPDQRRRHAAGRVPPPDGGRERSVVDQASRPHALRGSEVEVAGEHGAEDLRFGHDLRSAHVEAARVGAYLIGMDDLAGDAAVEDEVLPPSVGGERARGVGPERRRPEAVGAGREGRCHDRDGRSLAQDQRLSSGVHA